MSEHDAPTPDQQREAILDAMLAHVPFDGWSQQAFEAAVHDVGAQPALARAQFPGGANDLARAWHRRCDAAMEARLRATDLGAMRFRQRIAAAVRFRLEAIGDRELARRSAAHFALPHRMADGAALVWRTADLIWNLLGDTSEDINWYTKRATLSAVYSSTLLFWLGDQSPGAAATWEFLDRRIDEVMRFEDTKRSLNENALFRRVLAGPLWLLGRVRAPRRDAGDLPGGPAPSRP